MKFSELARQQVVPYWEGSLSHPFLTELQDGTLDPTIFRFYLIQDAYYLKHFSHLYELIAEQAQEPELKAYAEQSAAGLAAGELAVRQDFFETLAITDEEVAATAIAPTAYHYVSHMYRQLVEGTPHVAIAGMLPCPWLYQEVGQYLAQRQSPVPIYQRWIETYSGDENADDQQAAVALVDRLYEHSTPAEQQQMIAAFKISSQMEYSFWEMAYRLEAWPKGRIADGAKPR
ncbi:thiaminase II [Lacticaseibacillus zeae]|uniref:Aminopyrimidine aminohydrolase n=1 Tax=Lacticaseibacillus zeae subsp. silagei TaxID=3068307 RepID=A0ABD7ZAL6_LACZE|nr:MULTISPECIES: thiaminase II [Lacticaseibacillus]MDE3314387.1 thiaminase II [Lacticaseibacillus zeae]OFR98924.1 thiaminase II [Lactobacillus sp. HMSC068F07]WLV84019.1 thiaminase II [Lacticaseibacillus sp. NCIMB 15475]WLV86775.1 thiaminase II [Lacticaseibacillus sp. NCIMB 15474]